MQCAIFFRQQLWKEHNSMTSSLFSKYFERLSISTPTQIQKLCVPLVYEGKSVFGLAPTGSGKTLAFVLPLLLKTNPNERHIQTLILVPTRELGSQIAKVCAQVSSIIGDLDDKNILIRTALGGSPISKQLIEIAKKPHVLIATPGRLIDLLDREALDTKRISTLILDEADIMVGMGFSDQVQSIYKTLSQKIQIGLFSATQNEKMTTLEKVLLKNTEHTVCNALESSDDGNNKKSHDAPIKHQYLFSNYEEKYNTLKTFLKQFSYKNQGKMILFCQQKETAHELAALLKTDGFLADTLTGDLGQIHRNSVMRNFKTGNLKYLVATNIAARGIDIDKLAAVIHYDTPSNPEEYIHRTGRTGRSGYSDGVSITFCNAQTKSFYLKMMEDLGISAEEFKSSPAQSSPVSAVKTQKNLSLDKKIEFFRVHLNKGKKNNMRPGDILGAFIKELKLEKEDIGSIFIFDHFTHVEVNINKKRFILNQSFKVKNLAVKIIEAKYDPPTSPIQFFS